MGTSTIIGHSNFRKKLGLLEILSATPMVTLEINSSVKHLHIKNVFRTMLNI